MSCINIWDHFPSFSGKKKKKEKKPKEPKEKKERGPNCIDMISKDLDLANRDGNCINTEIDVSLFTNKWPCDHVTLFTFGQVLKPQDLNH